MEFPPELYELATSAITAQELAAELLVTTGKALEPLGDDPNIPTIIATAFVTAIREMGDVTPMAVRIIKAALAADPV